MPMNSMPDPSTVFTSSNYMEFIEITAYELKWDEMFSDIVNTISGKVEATTDVQIGEQAKQTQDFWDKVDGFVSKVEEYVKKGDFINTLSNTKSFDSIYLPLPNVLREVHHQMYEDSAYNMEDRFLRNGVKVIQEGFKALGDKGNAISDVMGSAVNLFDHISRRANLSADPNNLLTYAGSAPRTYTFSFNIVPQNYKEAQYYADATKWLKFYSLGKRETMIDPFNSKVTLNTIRQSTLFTFDFKANNSANSNHHLNTLFACDNTITKGFSLTNITSTVGDDGLLLYNDGSPKAITLSLTFTERKPLWHSELEVFYKSKLKKHYKL